MHSWGELDGRELDSEETEYLLKMTLEPYTSGINDIHGDTSCSNITTSGFDSMNIKILKPYDGGR